MTDLEKRIKKDSYNYHRAIFLLNQWRKIAGRNGGSYRGPGLSPGAAAIGCRLSLRAFA